MAGDRARRRRSRRNVLAVGAAPDSGRPRFPLTVVWKTQYATLGAIRGEDRVHRRVQTAGVVLQWRAVHRHEARRVRDGCARHRSGRQLLPSATAAAGDDTAAGPRRHPLTEAVLASPAAAIRLVGTLHDLSLWGAPARGPDTDISSSSTRHATTAAVRAAARRLRRPHVVGDHTRPLRPDRIVRYHRRRPRTVTVSRSYRAGRPLNARATTRRPQRRATDPCRRGAPQAVIAPRDCPHVIPRTPRSRHRAWG